jgi:ferric-dicitrate binding protein FerR (iron transport regulator)
MDCSEVRAQLLEAAFGLVDDPALQSHLETCGSCGPQHAALVSRCRALRSWGQREPTPDLHERILRRVRAGGRRRRLLAVAAGLLAGIAAGFFGARPSSPDRIEGKFEILQGARWTAVDGERPAAEGVEIRTQGGRARISLGGRSSAEVQPSTRIGIRGVDPSIALSQEHGEVHYRVRPGSGPYEVRTPAATIQVQGTEFMVRITGDETMNKGTVAATTLAAVVGVSSGLVTVRNSHGEIRVGPGQIATAPASAPPKLLADSEARLGRLEAERKSVAERVREDLERLQELKRHEQELDRARPAPKKAQKADSLRAIMSIGLRGNSKTAAKKAQKMLDLDDEQTLKLEEVLMKCLTDYLNKVLAETMTIEELERLSGASDDLQARISEVLTDDQKRKLAAQPLPLEWLGFSMKGSGYEDLLKLLDEETRPKVSKELGRYRTGFGLTMLRAQLLDTAKESGDLMDQFAPRTLDRLRTLVPADHYPSFESLVQQLQESAKKQLERKNDKK